MKPVVVAVLGAGYWGPNLVRNFLACPVTQLAAVCDLDLERAQMAVGPQSTVLITDEVEEILADPRIEGIALATPAPTHWAMGLACLEAGKHLLIEKPLASSVEEGRSLVKAAAKRGLTLMCDHTYCYTPAVMRLRRMIHRGDLGDLHYFDSVRINLGIVQDRIDVLWDLAPHDLSILDFILPQDRLPRSVAAQAADPLGLGYASVGYLTLHLKGGAIAHIHVNWLSPTKVRTVIVGGSDRMVVWDDLNPVRRLSVYDKGVDFSESADPQERKDRMISYRAGDVVSPSLPEAEALQGVVREFATAIRQQREPLTSGLAGLRVLRVLEVASQSLHAGGGNVPLELEDLET
jgi:predicted dehydrogenase